MQTSAARPRLSRRRSISRTQMLRRLVQSAFLAFIIFASLRHSLFEETTTAASLDALCPFAMPTVTPTVVHEPKGEASALGSTGSGDPVATVEIKGRQTLQEVADQAELPLADLIAGLDLPADTDASQPLRDLVAGGVIGSIDTVRIAVAGLQPD